MLPALSFGTGYTAYNPSLINNPSPPNTAMQVNSRLRTLFRFDNRSGALSFFAFYGDIQHPVLTASQIRLASFGMKPRSLLSMPSKASPLEGLEARHAACRKGTPADINWRRLGPGKLVNGFVQMNFSLSVPSGSSLHFFRALLEFRP
jgi:hypothetical protein